MRVLLIEDDKKLAGYVRKGLTDEQYAVDVYHDGVNGFFWATEIDYDLIILDIMLPQKDGISVCQDLRAKRIVTPILMLNRSPWRLNFKRLNPQRFPAIQVCLNAIPQPIYICASEKLENFNLLLIRF